MKNPKISIITITFNAEKFLERTIKSVINQTYDNIEYIIIDGKSSDNTIKIIKKYEKYITKWISEPDKGLYDAMNKGIDLATGDYIQFLNAGDELAYENVLQEVFQKCAGADLIYGYTLRVNEDKTTYKGWHKKTPTPEELSEKSFLNGMVICHQAMIVKREIVPKYDLKWKLVADIDWSIRLLKKVKTKCLADFTIIYFLEGGLSKQRLKDSLKERWKVLQHHFGFFPTLFNHIKIVLNYFKNKK